MASIKELLVCEDQVWWQGTPVGYRGLITDIDEVGWMIAPLAITRAVANRISVCPASCLHFDDAHTLDL